MPARPGLATEKVVPSLARAPPSSNLSIDETIYRTQIREMVAAPADPPTVSSDAWLRGLTDGRSIGAMRVSEPDPDFSPNDSGLMIVGGLGLGVFAAASLTFFGAACPVCVVAAPVLVGTGIAQRLIWRRRRR